ncbi:MAG: hypothetical protein KME08_05570 [Aphanothece sp. CMT-3BRIN-NPC111]|jgi:hypothetical protein|nr:hypothetical protein [Aphanothece sp. CMT-3BRIN-NPC111]
MNMKNTATTKKTNKILFCNYTIYLILGRRLIVLSSAFIIIFFRLLPAKAVLTNSEAASNEASSKELQQPRELPVSIQNLTENISPIFQQSNLRENPSIVSELQVTSKESNLPLSFQFNWVENSQMASELEETSRKSNLPFSLQFNQAENFRLASEVEAVSNKSNLPSSANTEQPQLTNQLNYLPRSNLKPADNDKRLSEVEPSPSIEKLNEDRNYIISPRIVDNNKINPITTVLPLNGVQITHLTEFETLTGYEFGNNRSDNLLFNGIAKLNSQIQESLTRNNILRVEQRGDYLQLQTVRQSRDILVNRVEPRTLVGLELQFSLTASCLFIGGNPNEQCTYTPGLETDRNSIDPNALVPTNFILTSQIGDVVTPESLAAISLPGFQRGANGQQIGLDFYLPNVGSFAGNTQSNTTEITRREEIENTPATFFSQVRQVIKANDEEAVIGRTVRGLGFVLDDKNTLINSGLQLGAEFLPDLIPNLKGSNNAVNRNINRNLFFAANNTRLPVNSFIIYHAGLGRASSPKTSVTNISEIPSATFNSVWFGISPVTERTFSARQSFQLTGAERLIASGGAEGGANSNLDLDFIIINGGDIFSNGNLVNFYPQLYASVFNRDINLITSSRLTEKTSYYPHISFTGDITSGSDVFRYYTGSIFSDKIKAYLGLDYAKTTLDGWRYKVGAIGYVNPDRDYYSQLFGNASKRIALGRNSNIVFSTAFDYELDRETRIGEQTLISAGSFVRVGAAVNFGSTSFELVNYIGDILPNSIDNTLLLNLGITPIKNLRLSAYFAPINENESRTRYGASAQLRLGNAYNSPTLSLNYTNYEYDYGSDPFGRELQTTEDVFRILFRFGEPAQPFSAQPTQRVRDTVEGTPTVP